MQAVADTPYASYRTDYCPPDRSAALSASDDWIYPNYTVSPQAAPSRVQLPSMYTTQRPPDQSYPSPSPSVPSPGPPMSSSLEYSAQSGPSTPPGADYPSARDCQLGPVRHSRTRQMSLTYSKCHGRRHSGAESQLGELDQDSMSRPQSPVDTSDSSRDSWNRLTLYIPGTCIPDGNSPRSFMPATPNSIPSPHHQSDYHGSASHMDGRPPSPASSNRSGSGSASGVSSSHYQPFPSEGIPPSHGRAPHSRVKRHTKKKLDALEKKRICNYHKDHQNARQEDIAEMFGIERSTVSKILKHKSYWLQVDDNAEVQSKNRPSKFPILEEKMREWLQDCTDRASPITDSLIRKRALEFATNLCLTEDKFKASAGWIENFKHRHCIRGGKWTQAHKNLPAMVPHANPGLNGNGNNLGVPLLPQLHPPSSPPSNPYNLASITNPDDTDDRPRRKSSVEEKERWSMPGTAPPRPGSPTAILSYHRSELVPPSQDDDEIPFASLDSPPNAPPTLADAEGAATTLLTYLQNVAPENLISHNQMNTLIAVKCALFQYASGVPYDTSMLQEHVGR